MPALKDLDYLAARLHGRRARMAEGSRLYALCGLASPEELAAALFPGAGLSSSAGIQRRLAEENFRELHALARSLNKPGAKFLAWLAARWQAENLKISVRRIAAGASPETARRLLCGPPGGMGLYGAKLAGAKTPGELLAALPGGPLKDGLARAYKLYSGENSLFFLEASLDQAYLTELLALTAALPGPGRAEALDLASQEADSFHLALVTRGKFFNGFEKNELLRLHVAGAGINRRRFSRMLLAPDLEAARALAGRAAPEAGGGNAERAAWSRYARLANKAFRGSGADLGLVTGYAALRRLEAANLTTVAEGLRLGVPAGVLRGLLIRTSGEENV